MQAVVCMCPSDHLEIVRTNTLLHWSKDPCSVRPTSSHDMFALTTQPVSFGPYLAGSSSSAACSLCVAGSYSTGPGDGKMYVCVRGGGGGQKKKHLIDARFSSANARMYLLFCHSCNLGVSFGNTTSHSRLSWRYIPKQKPNALPCSTFKTRIRLHL
jgi:hypothetical protein